MSKLMQCFLVYPEKSRQFFSFSVLVLFVMVLFSSCGIIKDSYYFKELKKDTTISDFVNKDIELKIQKNDVLSIQVFSLNRLDDAIFSQPSSSSALASSVNSITSSSSSESDVSGISSAASGNAIISGYRVDTIGNIYLHKLGSIHVDGMTLKDLKVKLEKDMLPYLKDPIVTVNFANHRVTVIGAVKTPHILTIPEEGLTIFDALAMCGDVELTSSSVSASSSAKDLIIVRDTLNSKQLKHINLENGSIFKSQWYYLKPNDIVYVNQNSEKLQRDQNRTNIQYFLSITSISLTLLVILIKGL